MKYVLIGIISILIVFAIIEKQNKSTVVDVYTLTYVVFYPNYSDTITISNSKGYYWGSDRGTNYIKIGNITGQSIYCNSAPYKVLSYTQKNEEDRKNNK